MPHFEGDFDGNPEADDNLCLESCVIRIDQRGTKFSTCNSKYYGSYVQKQVGGVFRLEKHPFSNRYVWVF